MAFVCAMPMEMVPLKRRLSLEKRSIGSLGVFAGSLGDRPIVAIVTGVGGVRAAEGVERLVETIDIDHVVVVGIAGAVHDVPIGSLVVPLVVVNGTTGAEYRPAQLGARSPRGTLWTCDRLITDLDDIAHLRA